MTTMTASSENRLRKAQRLSEGSDNIDLLRVSSLCKWF